MSFSTNCNVSELDLNLHPHRLSKFDTTEVTEVDKNPTVKPVNLKKKSVLFYHLVI